MKVKNIRTYIHNNQYLSHLMTLISGTLVAQIITFAVIPIITRIYTPEEFGLYSLFFSLVSIVGLVSSLKYEQAIVLPKLDKDAFSLAILSFIIIFFIFVLSIFIILIFQTFFLNYFHGVLYFLFLLPFGIALLGLIQVLNAYSSRKQFYKQLAKVKVFNAFSIGSLQIISKYFFNFNGLVMSRLIADFVSFIVLLKFHLKQKSFLKVYDLKQRVILNAKKYKKFPKYQSFTVFFNALSQNIPVIFLASLYSPEIAGFYALTARVLQVPFTLIGSSTKTVYYQRASKIYNEKKSIFNLYKQTTKGLLQIFIVPFIIILIFGDFLFSFIFGEEWITSGYFAQILIIWTFIGFINSPSVMTYSILELQKTQMRVEFISIFLRLSAIYVGYYFFNSFIVSVSLFAVSSFFTNFYIIMYIYIKLKRIEENGSYTS